VDLATLRVLTSPPIHTRIARTFHERMRGLLGLPPLAVGQALLLKGCSSVHTIGMKYAIDVVFLDTDMRVLRVAGHVAPGRLAVWQWGSKHVLELVAGQAVAHGIQQGAILKAIPYAG
jgi:uncharacterized protein